MRKRRTGSQDGRRQTSGSTQQPEEEQKMGAHVPWHLTHLEQMTVPAFSDTPGSNNNALPTHSSQTLIHYPRELLNTLPHGTEALAGAAYAAEFSQG